MTLLTFLINLFKSLQIAVKRSLKSIYKVKNAIRYERETFTLDIVFDFLKSKERKIRLRELK